MTWFKTNRFFIPLGITRGVEPPIKGYRLELDPLKRLVSLRFSTSASVSRARYSGYLRSIVGHESSGIALDLEAETLHDRVGPFAGEDVGQLGKEEQRQRRGRRSQD